jgi:hypothetical protein
VAWLDSLAIKLVACMRSKLPFTPSQVFDVLTDPAANKVFRSIQVDGAKDKVVELVA